MFFVYFKIIIGSLLPPREEWTGEPNNLQVLLLPVREQNRTEEKRYLLYLVPGTWYWVPWHLYKILTRSTGIQPNFMHAVKTIVGKSSFLCPAAHGFVVIRSTLVPFCRVIAIIAEWRHCR